MNWPVCLGIAGWALLLAGGLWFGYRLRKYRDDIESAQVRHIRYINELQVSLTKVEGKLGMRSAETVEKITGILSDPDMLDAELERSAQLDAMRKAKRRTLPRENAGPPARVSKMRIFRNN